MNKSDRLLGILALLICVFLLSACGGEGGNGDLKVTAAADNTADDGSKYGVTASDIATVNFSAVAGHETGLRRLAKIDGRIQTGYRFDVKVNFGNGVYRRGLLHNCSGALGLDDCEVWGTVTYDTPGLYKFKVTYNPGGLFSDPVTVTGNANVVAPGDFVVVSIGDSVASGEGNPVHPLELGEGESAQWDDDASNYYEGHPNPLGDLNCHRSITAGPVLAANHIALNNEITFIHIACSGASFGDEDLTTTNARIKNINTQLEWIRERFQRIDVLLLSGGANDTAWYDSLINCVIKEKPGTPCSEDPGLKKDIDDSIAELPGLYAELDRLIRCGSKVEAEGTECTYDPDPTQPTIKPSGVVVPAENQVPTVVAITEYFDPTHDRFGTFPSITTTGTKHCATTAHAALLRPKEWEFLYDNLLVPLNMQVKAAADAHSWTHVGGIADAFLTHGYCAGTILGEGSPSWVVGLGESVVNQSDISGTVHPNALGHILYGQRIYEEVVKANPSRTTASASTEGQPYTFGTWVATDVEVTLAAYNPIKESGVSATYYAVDEPQCNALSVAIGACAPYLGPIVITESGRHTVSFYSVNDFGAAETRSKPVEVLIDKEPPEMTCVPTPENLWPPNGKFVDVVVDVTAVDAVSGPSDFMLTGAAVSEGDIATDVLNFDLGTADTEGSLLPRRKGYGEGGVYILTYESQDDLGNVGTCDAVVVVPHDMADR